MARPEKYWYDQGYQIGSYYDGDPEDAPDPLSGEFAGQSIPEIFGSWEEATDDSMDAFESGYWAAVYGNPGEIPLHESLAEIANWVDYEAEVVAKAAENVDDSSLQNEAEQQAEMMEDAAESLQDASEQAAETAAEIYNETAVPSTENPDPLVAGNPIFRYTTRQGDIIETPGEIVEENDDQYVLKVKDTNGIERQISMAKTPNLEVIEGNPGDIPVVSDVAETAEEIVGDITPEPVQEKIQEQAVKEISDAPPEPADWLFRKRFAR